MKSRLKAALVPLFLLAVLPKEKQVLVLDSKAESFTKSSAENAITKMWKLLQQVDSSIDAT